MRTITHAKLYAALIALCFLATSAKAQTYTTIVTFDGANGGGPDYGPLVQGANGNFFGTTSSGGDVPTNCYGEQGFDCGTIFEVTPGGALTTLYTFCSQTNCSDGISPYSGLTLGKDGNFYGTTSFGAGGGGTIYKITFAGQLSTLYSFCSQLNCTDGWIPYAGLVQASNGNLYGTTALGGTYNQGVVFEIAPSGTYKVLYSFCGQTNCNDGANPYAGLIQASNGRLYGTTAYGGANGAGTVFSISLSGKFQNMHSFTFADGSTPLSMLVQATNGGIYGTTFSGGLHNGGTVFGMSPTGKLMTIYNFCVAAYCSDGANPSAGMIEGTNGELYGTTGAGGAHFHGSIFEISLNGKLKTVYSFCSQVNCADGDDPLASVVQASDGTLYGTTYFGGDLSCNPPLGCGVVFSLSQTARPIEAED